MSALEFVITLHLIVIGLAMTNLLGAIGDLFKYRERIDYAWLLPVWLLAMLFAGLALAFGIWQTESTISPSAKIFDVLPYFQYTVFLYLGCRILNPELAHRTHLDLDLYFLSIRKPFFAFSFIPQVIFFLSLAAADTPLPPLSHRGRLDVPRDRRFRRIDAVDPAYRPGALDRPAGQPGDRAVELAGMRTRQRLAFKLIERNAGQ